MGNKAASVNKDVSARGTCFEDRIPELGCASYVKSTTALATGVIAKGRVSDIAAAGESASPGSAVSANRTVSDGTIVSGDSPAIPISGLIIGDGATVDGEPVPPQPGAVLEGLVITNYAIRDCASARDAATVRIGMISSDRAMNYLQWSSITDAASVGVTLKIATDR